LLIWEIVMLKPLIAVAAVAMLCGASNAETYVRPTDAFGSLQRFIETCGSEKDQMMCVGMLLGTFGTLMYQSDVPLVCPTEGISAGLMLEKVKLAVAAFPALGQEQMNAGLTKIFQMAYPCPKE
jgi:hypothetical protein